MEKRERNLNEERLHQLSLEHLAALSVRIVLRAMAFTDRIQFLQKFVQAILYSILVTTNRINRNDIQASFFSELMQYDYKKEIPLKHDQLIYSFNYHISANLYFKNSQDIDLSEALILLINGFLERFREINVSLNIGEIIEVMFIEDLNYLQSKITKYNDGDVGEEFYERSLWGRYEEEEIIEAYFTQWKSSYLSDAKILLPFIDNDTIDWDVITKEYQEIILDQEASSEQTEDDIHIATMHGNDLADEDLLGRERLISVLSNMIISDKQDTPFVIGLFGDWGAGKSSLMKLIGDDINERLGQDSDHFHFAQFNAWEYENTDNMTAGLGQEVIRGLTEKLNFFQLSWLRLKFGLKEHGRAFPAFFVITFVLTIVLAFSVYNNPGILNVTIFGISVAAFLAMFWQIIKSYKDLIEHPISAKIKNYIKLPSYSKYLGDIPILKKHMESLCEIRLKNDKDRLVVFVDDLDRCEPDSISRTLDAIRLVMDIEKVVIMIGIDDRIAFKAVEKHYADYANERRSSTEIARDYLGKIIQLPVMLNKPSDENLKNYINTKLFNREELVEREENESAKLSEQDIENEEIDKSDISTKNDSIKESNNSTDEKVQTDEISKSENSSLIEFSYEVMSENDEEVEKFAELTSIFGFRNPRQLIRLRNCYRLFKGTRPSINRIDAQAMLFWLEYLYSINKEKRDKIIEYLEEESSPYIDFKYEQLLPNRIFKFIHKKFSSKTEYEELKRRVESFVLPTGE